MIPTERRNDAEVQRTRELLTSTPLPAREQDKPERRRKRTNEHDFASLTARVQAAVLALDALEDQGVVLTGIPKEKLAKRVSTPEVPISVRTLRKAEAYRKQHPR
jgi:hypothetical protein